jgi:hypothetical protein
MKGDPDRLGQSRGGYSGILAGQVIENIHKPEDLAEYCKGKRKKGHGPDVSHQKTDTRCLVFPVPECPHESIYAQPENKQEEQDKDAHEDDTAFYKELCHDVLILMILVHISKVRGRKDGINVKHLSKTAVRHRNMECLINFANFGEN